MSEPAAQGAIGLADLITLNDEIAALVRSGVPLGKGLAGSGSDLEGRLGQVARRIGGRMDRGLSLPEALRAEEPAIPPLYSSVVEAGARAGRLPAAMEGLASFARSVADLRGVVGLAMIYPLILLVVAYLMLVGLIVGLTPSLVDTFYSLSLPIPPVLRGLERLRELAFWWIPVPPFLLGLGLIAWLRGGRARTLDLGRLGIDLGWVPWMRGLAGNARAALYADLLALLLESRVPLPEALELAGHASGFERPGASSTSSEKANRGDTNVSSSELPPMLAWILRTGPEQGGLVPALRHAAEMYRQRARNRAELIRGLLPTLLVVIVGGGAVLLYALALYVPFTAMLRELAR